MASPAKNVAQPLVDMYKGRATSSTPEALYDRLYEFKGIGPKEANMALKALALFF